MGVVGARLEAEGRTRGGCDLGIGELARRVGVSERTIRYYEQIGLHHAPEHTPGGARRYCDEDVERLVRIRELQEVMGYDLDEIQGAMAALERLDSLRLDYEGSRGTEREEILAAALVELGPLRQRAADRLSRLQAFVADLDGRIERVTREMLLL